jgi:hypothetical protein
MKRGLIIKMRRDGTGSHRERSGDVYERPARAGKRVHAGTMASDLSYFTGARFQAEGFQGEFGMAR